MALTPISKENPFVCSKEANSDYLVKVKNVNFSQITKYTLNAPNKTIDVCNEHFADGTLSGDEVDASVKEINRIRGSKLHFKINRNGVTHKDPSDLVPSQNSNSVFDYLDVYVKPLPSECSLDSDLSFAMRTCGGSDHFSILANVLNYSHFSHPGWIFFPQKHGILHEMAHGFGMKHTPHWDANDQKYISTMQGNLEYLSALDVAYLRHYYPKKKVVRHRNYVASSLTRFDGQKGVFSRINPDRLYLDNGGNLKDCNTNAPPYFFVAWFNTGSIGGNKLSCGKNKIYLRQKSNHNKTLLAKAWKMATMPALSQDQWQGFSASSTFQENIYK